jgi:endonuclease/exonuclease/phosphatase family metal-dependent hydrolase
MPHRAYQRNVTLRRGGYGNAVISRFPLHRAHDFDLSVRFKKRRGAQILTCSVPYGSHHAVSVVLVNLHLGLIEFEQKIQLRRLLACHEIKSLDEAKPLIVAGDMNDIWGRLGRHLLEPIGFRPACDGKATFPAFLPMRALDQVFYRGPLALHRCFISRSEVARQASDHLPLVVDFELAGEGHGESGHAHSATHHHAGS